MMTKPIRRVVRLPEVLAITGFRSKETIRKLELRGNFSRRFVLNPEATEEKGQKGWDEAEILEWLEQRRASRDSSAAA
jgi:predicted DNA-binding transcriptional regulator AlpA